LAERRQTPQFWSAPQIANTDQVSRISSAEFVAEVERIGTHPSMDGRAPAALRFSSAAAWL